MRQGKTISTVTICLVLILFVVQLVLWFGEGGWIDTLTKKNGFLELEETVKMDEEELLKLRAEVRDLQEGHRSIEERARFEHGMLEKGEMFIQLRP